MTSTVAHPAPAGAPEKTRVDPVSQSAEVRHQGAYSVWVVALLVYLLAVFHRSSLAVAGLAAADRFDISASQLATFTMLQLMVYAGMQIPVGLLVDRFGPRRVLITGALILTAAQTGFAFADTYALALGARFFVGLGDAMTFICVLRLVNTWFAPRRIPLMTQLTGVIGQMGAIIAAVPMTIALRELGWTTSYLLAASLGIVLTVGLVFVVRDVPGARSVSGPALSLTHIRASLAASWAQPGTRLGFWIHFSTQFSATLLTIMVLSVAGAGPIMGWAITRHPWHRSTIVLSVMGAIVTMWTIVLLWPGDAPLWLLVVLVLVAGIGGPASVVGFDVGRTSNPADRLASATGIINQGGFVASLLLVIAIGLILDWRTPGASTDYTPSAFRWAMSAQYVLWVVGGVQIWRYRLRTRAKIMAEEPQAYGRTRL
jgi:predicted MFS family arabinose efflux permease